MTPVTNLVHQVVVVWLALVRMQVYGTRIVGHDLRR
jgi:hypothetical protein